MLSRNFEFVLPALHRFLVAATRWRRQAKLVVSVGLDAVALTVGFGVLVSAWVEICGCAAGAPPAWLLVAACAALSVGILWFTGAYSHVLRHWSARLLLTLLTGSALAGLASALLLGWAFGGLDVLLLLPVIWAIGFAPLLAWRLGAATLLFRTPLHSARELHVTGRPLVVYGAGVAGADLVSGLQRESEYEVVALVDDNPDMQGRKVHGVAIIGPAELERLLGRRAVEQVVVAIPSATVDQRRAIVNRLARFPVQVRVLPPLSDMVAGRDMIAKTREVLPEELLSRDPVTADPALLQAELAGKAVLVTGGGGSIGSALCREILHHRPARLVVFEISEFALYQVDRELRELAAKLGAQVDIRAVLGSVLSVRDVSQAISAHDIDIVYHAAAYKHVPLVEKNPMRGIENNVFGTLNVAEAAQRLRVGKFVLISTDKAVRPTNVMGASKRVAEKILEGLSQRGGETLFSLVRFGNVIDSAGSVVPLFRQQIAQGGPVTVTDSEVTRYFMTIPEAAGLVIQAGAIARENVEVFHLDMGEPVRIDDLARKLIHLSGRTVAADGQSGIEIRYTGLRPGDKLYEELLVTACADPTEHPRIFRARDVTASWPSVQRSLARLSDAVERNDARMLKQALRDCVEDYAEGALRPVPTPTHLAGAAE